MFTFKKIYFSTFKEIFKKTEISDFIKRQGRLFLSNKKNPTKFKLHDFNKPINNVDFKLADICSCGRIIYTKSQMSEETFHKLCIENKWTQINKPGQNTICDKCNEKMKISRKII